MSYVGTETSPCLYELDRPGEGKFTSAADIEVPERFETANEITCYVLGVQYAEAGIVGPNGRHDAPDTLYGMYPWEAHAFDCGARSVAGAPEPRAYSAYEADYFDRNPEAYGKGWHAGADAPNAYGEENKKKGCDDAHAFEAGQCARKSLETRFGVIECRGGRSARAVA